MPLTAYMPKDLERHQRHPNSFRFSPRSKQVHTFLPRILMEKSGWHVTEATPIQRYSEEHGLLLPLASRRSETRVKLSISIICRARFNGIQIAW